MVVINMRFTKAEKQQQQKKTDESTNKNENKS